MGAGASAWSTEELARCLEQRDGDLVWFAYDVRASGIDGASLLEVGENRDRLLQLTRSGGVVAPGQLATLVRGTRELRAINDRRDADSKDETTAGGRRQ